MSGFRHLLWGTYLPFSVDVDVVLLLPDPMLRKPSISANGVFAYPFRVRKCQSVQGRAHRLGRLLQPTQGAQTLCLHSGVVGDLNRTTIGTTASLEIVSK